MDIYHKAFDLLKHLPPVAQWPEMQAVLERAAALQPRPWRLPVIACTAVGGAPEMAVSAVSAMACLQIAILLVDDLLDEDPRGEYRRIGMPATANLALALQCVGMSAILQSEASPEARLAGLRYLSNMLLTTSFGQYLDTQNPADEAAYWRVVEIKSSPFFAASFAIGALMGGAPMAVVAQMEKFGRLYGEIIQIHDDLNDVMSTPANPDWLLARSPLPILYAQLVDHPDRERFQALRRVIPNDPGALVEAQTILVRCGAVSYCMHHLLNRYQMGVELLAEMALENSAGLTELLDGVIEPVYGLFQVVDAEAASPA